MHVTIEGLQARPELNGYGGTIVAWVEDKQRFMVELDGSGERLLLRPPNLHPDVNAAGTEGDASTAAGQEGGEKGPSEDTVLLMLESMWRVSLLDIEATLRHACNKVLSDQSVSKEVRRARARALVIMGRVFCAYGSADALKTTDFQAHMQQVGERMAEKAAEANDRG